MEIISAWEIYWVLQLDTIGAAAEISSFLGVFIMPFVAGFLVCEVKTWPAYVASAALIAAWLVVTAVAVFLPSTKTAAAMFVIPKIANSEVIQAEAGELYELAKQAMRRAVTDEPAKAKEAE